MPPIFWPPDGSFSILLVVAAGVFATVTVAAVRLGRFTVDEIECFENESGAVPAKKTAPLFPSIFRHHG